MRVADDYHATARLVGEILTAHLRGRGCNPAVDQEVNVGRGLLRLDCVLAGSEAATPQDVFACAARALQAAHGINAETLVQRLCVREGKGSTALGGGLALPHAATWGLTRPHAAFVRSVRPITFFPTRDQRPVHDVLVLAVPRPATALHHAMLHHYEMLLTDASFREQLRAAQDAAAIWRLFREREWDREPRMRKPGQRWPQHN